MVLTILLSKSNPIGAFRTIPQRFARAASSFHLSSRGFGEIASTEDDWTDRRPDDVRFMKLALRLAQHAYREKEVPIGAVVVDENGNVVSTGRNMVEETHDATAHAELRALRSAADFKKNWRLLNCTLYTTLEPCMMCLGAIQNFRISRVVYAAPDLRMGACGSWQSLHSHKHPFHQSLQVVGGVCEEDSAILLKRFFTSLRTEKFRYPGYDLGRGVCGPSIEKELAMIGCE